MQETKYFQVLETSICLCRDYNYCDSDVGAILNLDNSLKWASKDRAWVDYLAWQFTSIYELKFI